MTDADAPSQSGGYDVERFVDTPDYDLICTICQGVLRCPVRAACHHVFCKKCILQWLKRQETCPCCRKPIHAGMIFVMFKLSKSIGRMKIKCKNEIRGCAATLPLSEQYSHSLNCLYELVPCPYAGCRAQLLRRDLETHARHCEHWRQQCHMGCGTVLCHRTRAQHNCYMELKLQYQAKSRNHGAIAAALQRKMRRMQNTMAHMKRQMGLICESLQVTDELHKVNEDSGEGTSRSARTRFSSDG
ncbi:RING finger protein 151 [Phyllopteryx taeniolatus]|uniref:RING finger protein 151 n=1 Tax=Phyllopteryx taeniolatus TaxID=161469 RepID=UPI002AD39BB8|nr:RING finger protein 151 [Phyllopteryx taeniolatus]